MIICTTLITKEKILCEISDKIKGKERELLLKYIEMRNKKGLPVYWDISKFNFIKKVVEIE